MFRFFFIAFVYFLLVSSVSTQAQSSDSHSGKTKETQQTDTNVKELGVKVLKMQFDAENLDMKLSEILELAQSEECMDKMMENWLFDFVLLQNQGKSAQEAGNLANASAILFYQLCDLSEASFTY